MRSQLPQAYLLCFHCTNHSDEPPQTKIVSAKASTIWSLISIVQRQQTQTWLARAATLWMAAGAAVLVRCDFCPAKCERFDNDFRVI